MKLDPLSQEQFLRISVERFAQFGFYFTTRGVIPALAIGVRLDDQRVVIATANTLTDKEIIEVLETALAGVRAGEVVFGCLSRDEEPGDPGEPGDPSNRGG
jgi:hypothetical protein